MNTGEQVLEYLYHTQLQVDDRSPVRTEKRFTERCYLGPSPCLGPPLSQQRRAIVMGDGFQVRRPGVRCTEEGTHAFA